MRNNYLFFLIIIWALSGCSSNKMADWPQWRGPDVNCISPDTSLDINKLDSAHIVWTKDIGFGHSAIIVKGDKCFVSGWKETSDEAGTLQQTTIACINVEDGNEVWHFNYSSGKHRFPGPRSTPIINHDKLYSVSWEGKVFCLNANNGEEIWTLDLAADSLAVWDTWGFNVSPVIYDNLLLLNLNKTGMALNKNTGEIIWSGKYGISSWSSVYLMELEGKTYGIFSADTSFYLVNVENGQVESGKRRQLDWTVNDDVTWLPGNCIYTGNELYRLTGNSFEQIWANDSIGSFFRTGVVLGNYSFQFSDVKMKNFLDCVNLETGKLVWRQKLVGRYGNLIAVGNYLVILETFGKVIIAEANHEKYVPLKELQILSAENKQEYFCWAAPTFVNGRLFIRNSKGEMACIDLSLKN